MQFASDDGDEVPRPLVMRGSTTQTTSPFRLETHHCGDRQLDAGKLQQSRQMRSFLSMVSSSRDLTP